MQQIEKNNHAMEANYREDMGVDDYYVPFGCVEMDGNNWDEANVKSSVTDDTTTCLLAASKWMATTGTKLM